MQFSCEKENHSKHTAAKKTLAAAIKSSVFPPVHDPMYTRSILTLLHSLAKARLSGECGCLVVLISGIRNKRIFKDS